MPFLIVYLFKMINHTRQIHLIYCSYFNHKPKIVNNMPRTQYGRNHSRMNAFKHGLRATDELFLAHLQGRERRTFRKFRRSLYTDFKPVTDHEKLLVDRIAIQHFRLYRLYSLEYLAGKQSARAPLSRESLIPHLDRLSRYDWRIERQIRILQNELRACFLLRPQSSSNCFAVKE